MIKSSKVCRFSVLYPLVSVCSNVAIDHNRYFLEGYSYIITIPLDCFVHSYINTTAWWMYTIFVLQDVGYHNNESGYANHDVIWHWMLQ
jgi:hypothetical protein